MPFPLPIAHIAHWWMYLLYAVPVAIVFAASIRALVEQWREGRRREAEGRG
ncbi:MAG: hypothetical protein ACRDL6_08455 [Solirubrobacterales bacterium]